MRLEQQVRQIYLSLGPDYVDVLIKSELSSAIRGLTSEVDAKALYTAGRSEMQRKLKVELQQAFEPRGLVLEDVLLKAVKLPDLLSHSIELKAQAEQVKKASSPHAVPLSLTACRAVLMAALPVLLAAGLSQLPKHAQLLKHALLPPSQDSARMEFVLTKEQQEAARKAVEAGGIAEFQRCGTVFVFYFCKTIVAKTVPFLAGFQDRFRRHLAAAAAVEGD